MYNNSARTLIAFFCIENESSIQVDVRARLIDSISEMLDKAYKQGQLDVVDRLFPNSQDDASWAREAALEELKLK